MCQFKACPAGKTACLVPGCGKTPVLQQHEGFVLDPDAPEHGCAVRLFDRATGKTRRAVDLPGPPEDENHQRPYGLQNASHAAETAIPVSADPFPVRTEIFAVPSRREFEENSPENQAVTAGANA